MKGGNNKNFENRLWLARKRRGLQQKQVARLLDHKTIDQISRYENGTRVPTLETALKLEIIYGIPLRLLFTSLYKEVRDTIQKRATNGVASSPHLADSLSSGQCSYAELLNSPTTTLEERQSVRTHVTDLMRRMM
jgi:transcriptional regulator with XRE-family HTH domain